MGKLLLVTGTIAEAETTEVAVGLHADVAVFPVSVALFLTPKAAIKGLKELDLSIYEKILFPGLMLGDVSEIENGVGVPCFKGTIQVGDLPRALKKGSELSKVDAVEALLEKDAKRELKDLFATLEAKEGLFPVGKLKIGPVPRILAEVIDVPRLDKEDIVNQALHYKQTGADMIDIGAVAGGGNAKKLGDAVSWVKDATGLPVSIDSLDVEEIKAGIDAGAELVLSLDSSNIGKVDIPSDTACVMLPTDSSKGIMPKDRIGALLANIEAAKEIGLRKLLADPILEPAPRFAESLARFKEFKEKSPVPLFMGVGNVIELIDADSIGMNALLASAGVELGVAVMLTTEASPKTLYAVRELKRGLEMALLARARKSVPKDLGLCLLTAKGKNKGRDIELPADLVAICARADPGFTRDPKGDFHICVDFKKKTVIAAHLTDQYDEVIEGGDAESIWKEIEKKGLVSDKNHAAYLGRELQKAESCLRSGKAYIQDSV